MTAPEPHEDVAKARFRRTLLQVLIVQVVALAVLGVIQIVYNA